MHANWNSFNIWFHMQHMSSKNRLAGEEAEHRSNVLQICGIGLAGIEAFLLTAQIRPADLGVDL